MIILSNRENKSVMLILLHLVHDCREAKILLYKNERDESFALLAVKTFFSKISAPENYLTVITAVFCDKTHYFNFLLSFLLRSQALRPLLFHEPNMIIDRVCFVI